MLDNDPFSTDMLIFCLLAIVKPTVKTLHVEIGGNMIADYAAG